MPADAAAEIGSRTALLARLNGLCVQCRAVRVDAPHATLRVRLCAACCTKQVGLVSHSAAKGVHRLSETDLKGVPHLTIGSKQRFYAKAAIVLAQDRRCARARRAHAATPACGWSGRRAHHRRTPARRYANKAAFDAVDKKRAKYNAKKPKPAAVAGALASIPAYNSYLDEYYDSDGYDSDEPYCGCCGGEGCGCCDGEGCSIM